MQLSVWTNGQNWGMHVIQKKEWKIIQKILRPKKVGGQCRLWSQIEIYSQRKRITDSAEKKGNVLWDWTPVDWMKVRNEVKKNYKHFSNLCRYSKIKMSIFINCMLCVYNMNAWKWIFVVYYIFRRYLFFIGIYEYNSRLLWI